jgi:hypothetical protein
MWYEIIYNIFRMIEWIMVINGYLKGRYDILKRAHSNAWMAGSSERYIFNIAIWKCHEAALLTAIGP